MAQPSGFANTAPSPVPGGYGNPTGAQTHAQGAVPLGLPASSPTGVPQAYGSAPVGSVPTIPGGTPGSFLANGATAPSNTASPSLTTLSSGGGVNPGMLKQLQNDYGKGVGQQIYDMLSKGLFNPQVAQALIAAMQPQINRGLSATESAFGAAGARYSSAAAIGVGDYESQAVLGENQILANMYQTAQSEQLSLLENILPTVHQEQADSQSSGIFGDILGGLEIAGGIALAPFSGGASLPLIGSGISTIAGANKSGGGGGGSSVDINKTLGKIGTNVWGGNNSNIGPVPSTSGGNDSAINQIIQQQSLEGSAANAVGGPPDDNSAGNPMMDELLQAMMAGNATA